MSGPWPVAELLAVLFGFLYVWLAIREDARCWPVGIVNVAIYFFVFFHARLYATAMLQAVYVALSVYGWREWRRGGEGGGRLAVSPTPRRWAAGLAAAGVVASLGLGLFLRYRTDAALPFPDAATTAFSLVAQWMATRKWLENWLVWIAVDVVYLGVYSSQGLYLSTGLYAAFIVMASLGYRQWRASMARPRGPEAAAERGDRVTPLRVVLIGPECTGKTWLAGELAAYHGVPSAPEHAREYVERHREALTYADVEPIGSGQRAGEDAAIARAEAQGAPLVVLDTDLVSTMVYSRHYYGDCPRSIEEDAARRLADLYLLHHVDVEWVADGRQREQPERREELFLRFRLALAVLGARVTDVAGPWDARRQGALRAVDVLLAERRPAAR